MLTRLTVNGFKNLEGLDLRFGPLTCIAGANGVGKSNIFDAIAFLSALADKPLLEAAATVRGTDGRGGDVRSLFRGSGADRGEEIRLGAEMIIPEHGIDALGAPAKASMTFLRYDLALRLRDEPGALGPLEVASESMSYISQSKARNELPFPHSAEWRRSVVTGKRNVPYIETEVDSGRRVVLTRADSPGEAGGGRPRKVLASDLPRTVLSSANNAAEYRTLVLARQEMMGWTQMQLEPSRLREADTLHHPPGVGSDGAHLPATLRALIREAERAGDVDGTDLRARLSNRIAGLIREIRDLRVDTDERRNTVTLVMQDLAGAEFTASQLSDGTLRFIALALLQAQASGPRVLCFEEPENGIHPRRIPAMLELLADYAVDTAIAVDADNPLRQVIVNTHSPAVVAQIDDKDLVVAVQPGTLPRTQGVVLRALDGTWRSEARGAPFAAGRTELLDYLSPGGVDGRPRENRHRVVDRPELQMNLFSFVAEAG